MSKKIIIIATTEADTLGDRIAPDLIIHTTTKFVPISKNSSNEQKDMVGMADNIRIEGNEVKADFNIWDNNLYNAPVTPSIRFRIVKYEQKEDYRLLKDIVILQIGLVDMNIDTNVKPLNQQ